MRVLFHCWEFPPRGGGVASYIEQMARALHSTGHSAVIVTGRVDGLPEEEQLSYAHIYRIYEKEEIGSVRVRDTVLTIAKKHSVDLIEGADHLGDCASIIRAKHDIPVMTKIHACQVVKVLQDAHVYYPWQKFTMAVARFRAYGQMKNELYSIQNADLACVPTRRLHEELIKQGLRLPDKFAVVPNPIEVSSRPSVNENVIPSILFVGRIEFLKGIQFLPRIIESVIQRMPEARLRIAGPDSYARWVGSLKKWLVRGLGKNISNIDFLGSLTQEQLKTEYDNAWVVVMPTLWDNFPGVVLESMAYGKPIVTTPHGGMQEMLEGTDAPIEDPGLGSFDDAVINLLNSKDLRRSIGMKMFERVKEVYSPHQVVKKYIDFARSSL